MKKILIAVVIGTALSITGISCESSKDQASTADTIQVLKSELKVVIPYDSVRDPWMLTVADNRLLLANGGDTVIDRFTIDGKFVDSYLRRGQGPTEITALSMLQYAAFDNSIYVNERPHLPLKVIKDQSGEEPEIDGIITLQYTDSALIMPIGNKIFLRNGSVVTVNCNMEGMLAVFNPEHKFQKLIQHYPPKSEFGEGMPDFAIFNFYQPLMGVSPDGKHFVVTYPHCDIKAFGSLDVDTVAVDYQIKSAPKGIIIKETGGGYFAWEFNDEWINWYGSPALSNNRAYIPYYGTNIDRIRISEKGQEGFTQQILVYDFSGNHLHTIMIPDFLLMDISVTADDKELFILNDDNEEGIRILSLDLEKILK